MPRGSSARRRRASRRSSSTTAPSRPATTSIAARRRAACAPRRARLSCRVHAAPRRAAARRVSRTQSSTSTRRCCPRSRASTRSARRSSTASRSAGATVHLVTEELDGGPIVLQAAVPVRDDDTVETLSARILIEEHRIYPEAVRILLDGGVGARRPPRSPDCRTLTRRAGTEPVAHAACVFRVSRPGWRAGTRPRRSRAGRSTATPAASANAIHEPSTSALNGIAVIIPMYPGWRTTAYGP